MVTIEQNEIDSFENSEVRDNLEVYLDRGEKCELKIEADDNLHDIIKIDVTAKTYEYILQKRLTTTIN